MVLVILPLLFCLYYNIHYTFAITRDRVISMLLHFLAVTDNVYFIQRKMCTEKHKYGKLFYTLYEQSKLGEVILSCCKI